MFSPRTFTISMKLGWVAVFAAAADEAVFLDEAFEADMMIEWILLVVCRCSCVLVQACGRSCRCRAEACRACCCCLKGGDGCDACMPWGRLRSHMFGALQGCIRRSIVVHTVLHTWIPKLHTISDSLHLHQTAGIAVTILPRSRAEKGQLATSYSRFSHR